MSLSEQKALEELDPGEDQISNSLKFLNFWNGSDGKSASPWAGAIMSGMGIVNNLLGDNSEYKGTKGNITRTMDSAYDSISEAAGQMGGWGKVVLFGMQANKMFGKVANKLGAGTDGMTTQDAILGSAFFQLTPFGLINGIGGQKANKYFINELLDRNTGSGFNGFLSLEQETSKGAGKKYGLFSSGARQKLNLLTEYTLGVRRTVSSIVDADLLSDMAAQGSTPFISNQFTYDINGGLQASLVRAAAHGLKVPKKLYKFTRDIYDPTNPDGKWETVYNTDTGKQTKILSYDNRTASLNNGTAALATLDGLVVYLNNTGKVSSKANKLPMTARLGMQFVKRVVSSYRIGGKTKKSRGIDELIAYAKFKNPEFVLRMSGDPQTVIFIDKEQNPQLLYGTHYLEADGKRAYPRILEVNGVMKFIEDPDEAYNLAELTGNYVEFNSPEEAELFTQQYKQGWPDFFSKPAFNYGTKETFITPQSFKLGGTMNVIPEGALHARKHHLSDIDDKFKEVTHKGIPVITEEGGEIIQHAEIEHSEIIFNKEVTDAIEKLKKLYKEEKDDKYAIEAGKIIAEEILEHTDDRVNLIKTIE